MSLEDRLAKALAAHKPVAKRMFGGLCFMLNGNMMIGTFKDGLLVRIGKEAREAMKLPGATPFKMQGRVMEGYAMVTASGVQSDAALAKWISLALAFNATLPPKPAKKAKKK